MVNDDILKEISLKLAELCNANGVPSNLEVANYVNNHCHVLVCKEVANEFRDALCSVSDGLRQLPFVDRLDDDGRDKVLRGAEKRELFISVKNGYWNRSDADDKAEAEIARQYCDPEYAAEMERKRLEERRQYWEEYLIPLPKPDGNPNTELYLTMAYEPYDWIDVGYDEDGKHLFKRTEFRAYSDYWSRRLLAHPIKTVKFQRGYGGPGRGKPKQMCFEVTSITLWDPSAKMECTPENPTPGIVPQFFAINLGKRLS